MSHDELRGQYELYAMGTLEDPERAEIREHLDRGCEICVAEVGKARQMVALLGASAPPVDPENNVRSSADTRERTPNSASRATAPFSTSETCTCDAQRSSISNRFIEGGSSTGASETGEACSLSAVPASRAMIDTGPSPGASDASTERLSGAMRATRVPWCAARART